MLGSHDKASHLCHAFIILRNKKQTATTVSGCSSNYQCTNIISPEVYHFSSLSLIHAFSVLSDTVITVFMSVGECQQLLRQHARIVMFSPTFLIRTSSRMIISPTSAKNLSIKVSFHACMLLEQNAILFATAAAQWLSSRQKQLAIRSRISSGSFHLPIHDISLESGRSYGFPLS